MGRRESRKEVLRQVQAEQSSACAYAIASQQSRRVLEAAEKAESGIGSRTDKGKLLVVPTAALLRLFLLDRVQLAPLQLS